jgi:hypothetical protein
VVVLIRRLAVGLALPFAIAHPLHTSVTELTVAGGGQHVTVAIRVFADDFATEVSAGDSAAAVYVRERLVLTDRRGHRVTLRWEGRESRGDALVLRLSAVAPSGLAGGRAQNTILCDRFDDQVNVVRVISGSRVATLLFTRGAGPQALP